MEWLGAIGDSCVDAAVWLAGLLCLFTGLVWLMPCNRGSAWWRDPRAFATDLLYWFIMPLVGRFLRMILLAAGLTALWGDSAGFASIRALPFWMQCVLILPLQDLMLYWIHRVFHTRLAWSFHAVHHSSTVVDWLTAGRVHVVNYILYAVLADCVVLLLGFSVEALAFLTPINIVYSTMVHANLNWTFGPLRYVFASPVFHRWHHTREGGGRNFAPTFPLLDLVFGTFYMPANKLPDKFGNGEADFPEDFWGQLAFPLRRLWDASRSTKRVEERMASSEPAG